MEHGVFVKLETIERWLERMESDWLQIAEEWGMPKGGLDGEIKNGLAPEIAELRAAIAQAKLAQTVPVKGCRKRLAPGQWWGFCGETDMGQSDPALCTECGGEFILDKP